MLNKIVVAGRLVKDVEAKVLPNGKSVAQFTIACERDTKDVNGFKMTDFIDITTFGATADFCEKYTGKGLMIVVDGRLQMHKWEDKEGKKRTSVAIVANNVYPMEWRKGDAWEEPATKAAPAFDAFSDELPF